MGLRVVPDEPAFWLARTSSLSWTSLTACAIGGARLRCLGRGVRSIVSSVRKFKSAV